MSNTFYRRSLGDKVFDSFNIFMMLIFSVIMLYPLYNQLILSFNEGASASMGGIYLLPKKFTLANYQLLFKNNSLAKGAINSVLRVVVGTATCLTATGLLSYLITIRGFSGARFLRIIFLITMYFGGGLIPTYLLIGKLGMFNTFTVYWLPTMFNAYYMLLISSYMMNLPESLSESARLDGAGELRIFWQIILPVSLPVFAAISVYSAVAHWNSWFDVLIYNPDGRWDTLQVYLRRLLLQVEALEQIRDQQMAQSKFRNLSPTTLRAATTMVVTIPIVIVYPFLQKYFVKGITLGSVKG